MTGNLIGKVEEIERGFCLLLTGYRVVLKVGTFQNILFKLLINCYITQTFRKIVNLTVPI